ncbi:MAG TPA: hypothetical protein VFQ53_03775 [Kofleriaceae bacterium]|nr:hypothetical protein [Kofleriaceae bacterium]
MSAVLFVSACTSEDPMVGYRSDGVLVECSSLGDDVNLCTPADGDEVCETWQDGGPATVLWPPNHKLYTFTLDDCITITETECEIPDPPTLTGGQVDRFAGLAITSITSDEAVDVGAGGDGSTGDYDVAIVDDQTFQLRSERQGDADGRVYRVNFVDTISGRTGVCEFLVPHDLRTPTPGAVDSGTQVTVTP